MRANQTYLFTSENDRLVSQIGFYEQDDAILLRMWTEWDDPISETRLTVPSQVVYMLETHNA